MQGRKYDINFRSVFSNCSFSAKRVAMRESFSVRAASLLPDSFFLSKSVDSVAD